MELMHHYTSMSYRTLSNDAAVQKVLQYDLPRLALQHQFLLHQLLAFAGYHLAYLHRDHRHAFLFKASQHQNSAIEGLRTTLASAVISENCHVLYATSMILTVSSFASFPSYDKYNGSLDPIDSILDVFSLVRGMSMILRASDHEIRTGPLATLFIQIQGEKLISKDSDLKLLDIRVERLGFSLGETESSGSDASDNSSGIQQAITSIRNCIKQAIAKPSPTSTAPLRASFIWPVIVGTEYIASLRQRHPAALVVLAFYCTILRMAEASCWALESWAESILKCVCNSLEGSHWEKLLEWPKQVVVVTGPAQSTRT